ATHRVDLPLSVCHNILGTALSYLWRLYRDCRPVGLRVCCRHRATCAPDRLPKAGFSALSALVASRPALVPAPLITHIEYAAILQQLCREKSGLERPYDVYFCQVWCSLIFSSGWRSAREPA